MDKIQELITTERLRKEVAQDCKYKQYEVDDVLTSLARVIQKHMLENNLVKLKYLFTLVPEEVDNKIKIKLYPDGSLERVLNANNRVYTGTLESDED